MVETLKKVFYTSVGLVLKSKEKVEEAVRKFVEENKMSGEEGERFVQGVLKQVDEAKSNLMKNIEQTVKDVIGTMGFATKKDLEELEKRLTNR